MGKLNNPRLFLILILSYLSDRANGKVNFKEVVDAKLKQLNKPAVKTIQSEDGDIIDCVDIYKQPAFDYPTLKNHVTQMRPSFDLKKEKPSTENESSKPVVSQTWQRSGSCPEGTIQIRRIRREDLLRAESIDRFGRKPRAILDGTTSTGCYDLNCDGFVHTNPEIALGAALEPLSSLYGQQYYITVGMFKDPQTNNWWVKVGGDTPIGYWPGNLFSFLNHSSTLVECDHGFFMATQVSTVGGHLGQ